MALYVLAPFATNIGTASAGSGASSALQSFTLYSNTESVIVFNMATGANQYLYYFIAYDYVQVPATMGNQNSGVIAPSSTLSLSVGTSTRRPGSGTDGDLKLFFAADNAAQQARLTQILVNRT